VRSTWFAVIALVIAGCGNSNQCETNPGDCTGSCTGQCVPVAGDFSEFLVYLASFPVGSPPPACPDITPLSDSGYLDTAPTDVTCSPSCTCGASLGGCSPPSQLTANSGPCSATGTGVPFDAPEVWSGACTTQDSVSSADSVTVSPPQLAAGGGCNAAGSKATAISGGKDAGLLCYTSPMVSAGACPGVDQFCGYPSQDGFSLCLLFPGIGDVACPAGWPVKHRFWDPAAMCVCNCGNPTGEGCSTSVSVYSDSACQDKLNSVSVSATDAPMCVDVAPGSALGSKAAVLEYMPGMCAATLTKLQVETLCCLQ
jgi:hypothetical protein